MQSTPEVYGRTGIPIARAPWVGYTNPGMKTVHANPNGDGLERTRINVGYADGAIVAVTVKARQSGIGLDWDRYYDLRRDQLIDLDEAAGVRPREGVNADWAASEWQQRKIDFGKNAPAMMREAARTLPGEWEVLDRAEEHEVPADGHAGYCPGDCQQVEGWKPIMQHLIREWGFPWELSRTTFNRHREPGSSAAGPMPVKSERRKLWAFGCRLAAWANLLQRGQKQA